MESVEQNRLLTQVGRATPMGELMRRYWQPIAAVDQFDDAFRRGRIEAPGASGCWAKTWCCFATARASGD